MKYDIKNLTLDEKLHLLTGKDFWRTSDANGKLKSLFLSDGPNGLRMIRDDGTTKFATAMPTISALASTWNPELAYLQGNTIADDVIEKGADVLLAPGVNIKRTPLNGRNFEYFSEDPYLAGTLAREYIRGVQDKGIGTSLKHYCCNNREYDRTTQTSEVDERTLHEIYLKPFEIAVEAEPWTVMCSYNPINGIYASENKWVLKDILRDEFGFNGVIVSDWGAVHSSYKAVKATLDLRMPFAEDAYPNLRAAYEKGLLREEEIDECVERILELVEKAQNDRKKITTDKKTRHENAVKIANESIVLLKNDGVLPLKTGKILLEGAPVVRPYISGGGSSEVVTDFKQTPLTELLKEKLPEAEGFEQFLCDWTAEYASPNVKFGYEAADRADYVVLCVGEGRETETEGSDRWSIKLSKAQEHWILKTAEINPNTIVCVYAGSAIDMSAWIDKVKAVVFVGYAGEGVNEALSSILSGEISPSGKLAETFPLCLEDTFTGSEVGNGFTEWYNDGIFIGYRYYDREKKQVLFPFGHGLSYAHFEYSDLEIKKISETEYDVSYNVTNTSDVGGKEISQVYVKDVFSTVVRPEKELKGYSKDYIGAHETKRITVRLTRSAFAYYSVCLKDWYVENGKFVVSVGRSSRDLCLSGEIEVALPEEEQFSVR